MKHIAFRWVPAINIYGKTLPDNSQKAIAECKHELQTITSRKASNSEFTVQVIDGGKWWRDINGQAERFRVVVTIETIDPRSTRP